MNQIIETDISNARLFLPCYSTPQEGTTGPCIDIELYAYSAWNYFDDVIVREHQEQENWYTRIEDAIFCLNRGR
jgi:hypothetical protein